MTFAVALRAGCLMLVAALSVGCSFKTSKPAPNITLAEPQTFSSGAQPSAQNDAASSTETMKTDTGASTNVQFSGASGEPAARPANAAQASRSSQSPIPFKVLASEHRAPGCKGKDCPILKIKLVEFAGRAKFNGIVDQALATMAGVDQDFVPPYRNTKELVDYFNKTAKKRQEIDLQSEVVRSTPEVIVLRLNSYIFNGGANGLSATQYVNWVFKPDRLLSLESMLVPGGMPRFEAVLKAEHARWLQSNPLYQESPDKYQQVWPFVPSDNVGLMKDGLAVQYDPYSIAPGSFGQPVIMIPYDKLKGIIRPEVVQIGSSGNK